MFNLMPWRAKKLPIHHEEQSVYSLQREVNRLFDHFLAVPMGDSLSAMPHGTYIGGDLSPRIDMSETDKELIVKMDVPGMNENDLELNINHEILTVSGEKKQEEEKSEKGWYWMERQYGSFIRTIALPYEVETDKAEALYKNGVLTVKMPISPERQLAVKSIAVKSAD